MLVLASNSPRRKQLLALGGWEYKVLPVDIDEGQHYGENPEKYVVRLAQEKANAAAMQLAPTSLIIAADTCVVDGDKILGKPSNEDEAWEMLKQLRGRMHLVYTAICVLDAETRQTSSDLCRTDVFMRSYSEEEISNYIASGDPLDKAGAYAIQHHGFDPVEKIDGCYANVVGLPLCHLERKLRKLNIVSKTDIALKCQETLQYNCSFKDMILQEA
jgi:septum formation protein